MNKSLIKKFINKDFFNTAKKISIKTKKVKLAIIIDILFCNLKYHSSYKEYYFYEFYNLNNEERKSFLTNYDNEKIINKYNNKELIVNFKDKGEFYEIFKEYLKREFLDLRDASFKDFKTFIKNKDKIVVKSINNFNETIEIIDLDKDKLKNEYNILKLYNTIIKKEEFLVEEIIVQNKELSSIYDKSVNIVRVNSFLDNEKNVHILSRVLKLGKNENTTDILKDGMYALINEDGVVSSPAIDKKAHIYKEHPKTLKKIEGFKIPNFEEVENLVKEISKKIPEIKYVSWDIAILENEVSLIKGNAFPEIFQIKPSILGKNYGEASNYKKYIEF